MRWRPPISINTLFVFNFNCPSPGYRIPEHVIEKDIILTVRPVICEGYHFTHMLKTLTCPYHFTKRGGGEEGGRHIFIDVPVRNQKSGRSWICVFGVSVWPLSTTLVISDFSTVSTLVLFVFHFLCN